MVYHEIEASKDASKVYLAEGEYIHCVDISTEKVVASYKAENSYFHRLRLSRSGKYLLALENAGKEVHVIDAETMETVSKRVMGKRPSSLDSASDDSALIVSDKFGDVYGLDMTSTEELLVENSPNEHKVGPVVGHVSMVTDVALGEHEGRRYVISADRDEHIRVSRYPQGFVVERWLFGHKEFVSRISTVPGLPELLVSAGGDDFVALWNWTTGEALAKYDLRGIISEYLTEEHKPLKAQGNLPEITVSSLALYGDFVLVVVESTKAIVQLRVVDGNALDLVSVKSFDSIVVDLCAAADKVYALLDDSEPVRALEITDTGLSEVPEASAKLATLVASLPHGSTEVPLFHVKQLRKRGEF
ncbi:tRNA (guanine-N(7)-)-methyltransferase non-catalytic subunit Trm82p [Trichomonascus vanleenenianus]|uniref:Trm82p n=1 Tax=Trichomonascus vanleenenianus TaxID=2268995 RepID=UPI003ECB47AE